MRSEPPLRTKKQKPMQTIKSKTTRDDKKMNRHPKNKTTKAENHESFAHSVEPGLVRVSRANAKGKSKPSKCLTIHAARPLKSLCKTKANDHNERKNNESINGAQTKHAKLQLEEAAFPAG